MSGTTPPAAPTVRAERDGDAASIHAVHREAFPADDESKLVDRLRERGRLSISLVAELEGEVVGHVAFSPVRLAPVERVDVAANPSTDFDSTLTDPPSLGLAPVAVLSSHRRRGIAAALVRAGLDRARKLGTPFVVVLGDPAYYGRFGFLSASRFQLRDEYGGGDAFQALECVAGSIPPAGGLVQKRRPDIVALRVSGLQGLAGGPGRCCMPRRGAPGSMRERTGYRGGRPGPRKDPRGCSVASRA